jgi:hypothetical protein
VTQNCEHQDELADDAEVPAHELLRVLHTRTKALYQLSQELEDTLSETLTGLNNLSPKSVKSMQRIDYLRQSLKDMTALLGHIEPEVCWRDGQKITQADLQDLVDMRDSLGDLTTIPSGGKQPHDIWL